MSYLVLHMDKFKKEAVRGIQSHNCRERTSHSNPDIDYGRSAQNVELHAPVARDYAQAIQKRIGELALVKAVRKDAVHLCGLILTSDSAFFKNLSPEDIRRFFEAGKAFLSNFVGRENVVSAMIHMDEKTPHLHFLHVPVTPDGRLNANGIYTRASLKKLQTELPHFLQKQGFAIQRGVEQVPGSVKKHLDTPAFKQQQEAQNKLVEEAATFARDVLRTIGKLGQREQKLKESVEALERQAAAAEIFLREQAPLPQASLFNYKSVLEQATYSIDELKKALALKNRIKEQNERLQREVEALNAKQARLEAAYTAHQKQSRQAWERQAAQQAQANKELETCRAFMRQPEIAPLLDAFLQRQRDEALRQQKEERAAATGGRSAGARSPWSADALRCRQRFAQAEAIAPYASLREAWATVPLDRKAKSHLEAGPPVWRRSKTHPALPRRWGVSQTARRDRWQAQLLRAFQS